MVATYESWRSAGERLDAWLPEGGRWRVFLRATGPPGPTTTFFHGFPTSSWDWARVDARLPPGRRRMYVDHLGFGDSDKPRRHTYAFAEQIDLALAAWERVGVESTLLVAHDYSVSMAQEILARIEEGWWSGPSVDGVVLLNGALFASLQNPLPIQRVLRHRLAGPLAARLVNEVTFARSFHQVFAPGREPTHDETRQHWESIRQRDGHRIGHLVSRYHEERRENETRWARALERTSVPLVFAWGMLDPVSGAPMLARARELCPDAAVEAWPDVGHYPQLEAPDRVATVISRAEAGKTRLPAVV